MTEPKLPRSLAPDELRRRCNPQELGFRTTDDLEDPLHIVGQSRAVDAIRFAVGIDREGYNMFAAGPSGTGKHSTLRHDVVEAVRAGRFHIHAVATIDEGIALLTGMAAGERGADGKFAEGTINARVEARLAGFAESARHFARSAAPDDGDHRRH